MSTCCIFAFIPASLLFIHIYSILLLLPFIPLLSSVYLLLSGLSLSYSLLSLQVTVMSGSISAYWLLTDEVRQVSLLKDLPDVIRQPVQYHYKQKGSQRRSLIQSYPYPNEPILHTSRLCPHACSAPASHHIPDFLMQSSWHHLNFFFFYQPLIWRFTLHYLKKGFRCESSSK